MLFDDHETQRLLDLVRLSAEAPTKDYKKLLDEAKGAVLRRKVSGYDEWAKGIRERYSGKQQDYTLGHLKQRFPETWEQMPLASLNYMRLIASQDAGVYGQPPERWLEINRERLDDEDPNADATLMAAEESSLNVAMGELERRCNVALTGLMRGLWVADPDLEHGGRISWALYWPDQVGLVYHPLAVDFSTLNQAVVILAETASPVPQVKAWEMWTRTYVEEDPNSGYGPWVRRVLMDDGSVVVDDVELGPDERLPWVLAQVGRPAGSPWIEPDYDLPVYVDTLNGDAAAMRLASDFGASPILFYSGTAVEGEAMVIGPGAVNKLGPNERLEAVRMDPQLQDMALLYDRSAKALASTRENSPDAYTSEVVAESGVSRLIKNIPHERRLDQLKPNWVHIEERQVLPLLISLVNKYAEGATIAEELKPRMKPTEPQGYETEAERTERVLRLLGEGLIGKPRALVMLGEARDEAEARAMVDEQQQATAPAVPGLASGSPFTSTRETTVGNEETPQQ